MSSLSALAQPGNPPGSYQPPPLGQQGNSGSYVPQPQVGQSAAGASGSLLPSLSLQGGGLNATPPQLLANGFPGLGGLGASGPSAAAGPPSFTTGIPDPSAIARQKDVYLKMLDEQLKQGINVLDQQVKYQRDYLAVQCEQQKKQFLLQLDQQMKAQEMTLTQQYNEQLMALQMQAGTQKAALEQQAMQLSMEFEQRKAEEHMYRQQYEIQQQQTEMAMKMAQDYQRLGPAPNSAARAGAGVAAGLTPDMSGYRSPMPGPPALVGGQSPFGSRQQSLAAPMGAPPGYRPPGGPQPSSLGVR